MNWTDLRLTDPGYWRTVHDAGAASTPITRARIEHIRAVEAWIPRVLELIPDGELDLLELGCAPGTASAALCLGRRWRAHGVDFVEGAGGYLETMALVDRAATLIHGDVMDVDPGRTFDVVCSVGLVEHFEGAQRRRLLLRHHELVAPGGYIVVVMPCFRGAQYLYHRVFDGPDLARHALDAMTPRTFDLFGELGVETLACGHVGRLRLWVAGPRPRGGRRRRVADAVGTMIRGVVNRLPVAPSGPGWSPYLLFVGCRAGARSAPPRG